MSKVAKADRNTGRSPKIIFVLIAVIVAIAGVLLYKATRTRESDTSVEINKRANPQLDKNQVVGDATDSPPPLPAIPSANDGASAGSASEILPDETKNQMLQCVTGSATFAGVRKPSEFSTLDDYFARAPIPHGGQAPTREFAFRNIHATSASGEKLRLRVSKGDTDRLEIRLFGVDEEDLPVPKELPPELADIGVNQAAENFIASNHAVSLDEMSESIRWEDGASAVVLRRNGRIEEMQIFLENHRSLGCAVDVQANAKGGAITCKCL